MAAFGPEARQLAKEASEVALVDLQLLVLSQLGLVYFSFTCLRFICFCRRALITDIVFRLQTIIVALADLPPLHALNEILLNEALLFEERAIGRKLVLLMKRQQLSDGLHVAFFLVESFR